MSAETRSALDDALAAHVADELADHIVSGYVMEVHVVDMTAPADEPNSRYMRLYPPRQPYHETYGLLVVAQDDHVASGQPSDE